MIKLKITIFLIFIAIYMISCNNKRIKSNVESSEKNKVTTGNTNKTQESKINASDINSNQMIEKLQGEWREPEYPFRRAEFKNLTVKFTEEGLIEEPKFEKFEIAVQCPFTLDQSKNIESNDNFIVMIEDETCQKLKISNDTLIFSGFNSNTDKEYHIVYKKFK